MGDFVAKYSTDTIFVGEDMTLCLTDELNNKADIDHVHSDYALTSDLETLEGTVNDMFETTQEQIGEEIRYALDEELGGIYEQLDEHTLRIDDVVADLENKASTDHTHDEYALSSDLTALTDVVSTKADSTHTHSEYASISHSHDDYATQVALDALDEVVNGKADATHSHNEYALSSHEHDNYAPSNHNHDTVYAPISHSHDDYVTTTDFGTLVTEVSGKADDGHIHAEYASAVHEHTNYAEVGHTHENYAETTHNHDNAYASQTDFNALEDTVSEKANAEHTHEIGDVTNLQTILDNKSNIDHNHNDVYATVSNLNAHANNTEIHITDVEKNNWNAKSDFSGDYNDLTNKPNIPSIDGLASEDYVDTKVSTITVESIGALPNTTVIPTVPTNVSAFTNDAGYLTEHQSLDGLATETYVDTQIDAIDIPTALSDLTTDSTHRVVTDSERAVWDAKSDFSGSYNDLTDKPSIPSISGLATETYVDEAVSTKANASHSHNDIYYTEQEIEIKLADKADSSHTHTGVYDVNGAAANALTSANAYTDNEIEALSGIVGTKANASDLTSHTGNTTVHITSVERNKWNAKSDFSGDYNDLINQPSIPSIVGLATETYVDEALSSKADNSHNHDSAYYTQLQVDSLLSNKSNSTHNHDSSYDALGTAETKANEVQSNLDVVSEDLSEHIGNSTIHFTEAERTKLSGIAEGANNYTLPSAGSSLGGVKSGGDVTISNGVITVNDDSHNHTIANVDGLQSALDSKASSGHTHSDVYTETEVDTLLEGKANTSHAHSISDVTSLQSALDGKASSNHGTHVSYSSTTPVMDGTASVGTASTVARSDHKHPTDTSRAAQTSLDSHTGNTTVHTNATERSNLNTAYTHSQSAHAPSNAEKNQNAFSYVKVGTTSVAADTATDTLTLVAGNNVTITPDATGDSITISSTDTNTTYSAGTGISLSGTTFSNSGVRSISTGSTNGTISVNTNGTSANVAVKGLGSAAYTASTAYDVAGAADIALDTAKEYTDTVASGKANSSHTHTIANISNLQTTLDGKAASSHTHKVSNISDLTATATELNYMDGVTSNVQTQLDGKAASGHTHSTATTSVAGLMSAEDKAKLNGIASGANAYTLPTASSSTLGGVKTTSTVTSNSGYTACPIISGVPYYKDTNTTYNLGSFGVTATAAELNVLDGITATVAELNYVDGVTSNIQTQLNGKASSSHTHNYAGSSSAGGAATSANKLNTNAGDASTPVYFANGVPVACTSLDLNTTGSSASCTGNAATATNVAWSGVTSKPSYFDAKAIKSITRNGTTFTYTCMDGTTGTFTQQDNNTAYSVVTSSANGLMSASDKSKLDSMELATASEVKTYLGI